MTPDERELLADINLWRREEGWLFNPNARGYEPPSRNVTVYIPERDDVGEDEQYGRQIAVSRHLVPSTTFSRLTTDHYAASVTEAVNLLCALGILPERFSTLWRAGYAAGEAAGWNYHVRQMARSAMAGPTPDAEVT